MKDTPVVRLVMLMAGFTALLIAAGCVGTGQSPPSRFYMLSSIEAGNASAETTTDFGDAGIGLGPLRFPAYVNRQQIVTRISPHEVRLAEFDRWAEPLENNFINVLKENLSILLGTAKILEPPWPKETGLEFQVVAAVSRFDAEPGKQAVLQVRWAVVRVKDERMLMLEKSAYRVPLRTGEYEEIVQAQSQTVAKFSRDIAAAVQELYRREHGQ